MDINNQDAIVKDSEQLGKKIKVEPVPNIDIGAEIDNELLKQIADAGIASQLDISEINKFSQVGQSRNQMYTMIDSMCQDAIAAAILETYAEDATEYNDKGRIVWVESNINDEESVKYIDYLLKILQVDKNIYKWVYGLCKYGDVYLELFKESEYKKSLEFENGKVSKTLNEDIKINAYSDADKYAQYIEMVSNPAEMFELTRFGKTAGFIKANVMNNNYQINNITNMPIRYSFKTNEINIYAADKFVHASLEDNTNRTKEEVTLFLDSDPDSEDNTYTYSVKTGQSLFYSTFKIWRELSLLENAMLLNRVTKSSVVRAIEVEVGDMPKEQVQSHLYGIKALFEQKEAINKDNSMSEYTNPGPIENNIYIPTRDGKGSLNIQSVGGDVNISQLPDIEYFQNKYFGAMRIPKQYFGLTDDGAGFNGGQSLAIISSRYAKMIKRIQITMLQALTTVINLFLIDKGLSKYINTFTLHMLPPGTQEDLDRQDSMSSKIAIVNDIMNLLNDIQDPSTKLSILKSLLNDIIQDQDIASILQNEIDKLKKDTEEDEDIISNSEEEIDLNRSESRLKNNREEIDSSLDNILDLDKEEVETSEPNIPSKEETISEPLPSPNELGDIDFTDNTNSEF